jgi:hypothetical protein
VTVHCTVRCVGRYLLLLCVFDYIRLTTVYLLEVLHHVSLIKFDQCPLRYLHIPLLSSLAISLPTYFPAYSLPSRNMSPCISYSLLHCLSNAYILHPGCLFIAFTASQAYRANVFGKGGLLHKLRENGRLDQHSVMIVSLFVLSCLFEFIKPPIAHPFSDPTYELLRSFMAHSFPYPTYDLIKSFIPFPYPTYYWIKSFIPFPYPTYYWIKSFMAHPLSLPISRSNLSYLTHIHLCCLSSLWWLCNTHLYALTVLTVLTAIAVFPVLLYHCTHVLSLLATPHCSHTVPHLHALHLYALSLYSLHTVYSSLCPPWSPCPLSHW